MLGASIARVVCGLTTLGAARHLGPSEFGEANLSLAASLWIQIPLFLGIHTAIIHYISKASKEEKKGWISEGVGVMIIFMVLTVAACLLFRSLWGRILGISDRFFFLALVWCVCYWPFVLLKSLLNAMENFAYRTWVEVLYALLFPLALFFWIKSGYLSSAYILGLSLPYFIVGVGGLVILRPSMAGCFSFGEKSKKLIFYGLLCTTGGLVTALYESPARLVANHSLSLSQVGILSAYQSGSVQMALFFLGAFSQVFFPIASRTPDKRMLFKKINRIIWPLFPVLVIAFGALLWIYLSVLGKKYPIEPLYGLIFSICGSLGLIGGVLNWFVVSYGWRGIVFNAVVGIFAGVINIFACRWGIPRFQIAGAGLAYLIATATGILILYLPVAEWWLYRDEEKKNYAI